MTTLSPSGSAGRAAAGTAAGVALVLGVAAAVASFAGGVAAATMAVAVVGGALSPALAVAALTLLYRRPLGLGRSSTAVVIGGSLLAFVALTLSRASFSVGMEEGDRGEAPGLFGALTAEFLLAALLAGVASATPVARRLLRGGELPRGVRWILVAVSACAAGPTVLLTMITPQTPPLAAAAALLLVALAGPRVPVEPPVRVHAVGPRVLAKRVRILAVGALLFLVVVWGGGLAAIIAGEGTPLATSAFGYAAATAQLAAVPLLIAATLLVAARAGGGAARGGAVVAIVVVVTASALMVALYDPSSNRYVLLSTVIALGAGCWIGGAAWQLDAARTTPDRAVIAVSAAAVGALVYLASCSLPGGLGLLLVSGYLVFGGRMLVPGRAGPLSPATLPAS